MANLSFRMAIVGFLVMVLSACTPAWKKPEPIDQVPFRDRQVSATIDGVKVTVAVPSRDETTRIFGTSLYRNRIQPVWVEVDNQSDHSYVLLKVGMDENFFSPLETSYQRHSGSKETKLEMDLFFHDISFRGMTHPGKVNSGFVFTNLDEGYKAINIDLLADGDLISYSFVAEVPGLVTDYDQIDIEGIWDELIVLNTEEELINALQELPCCATNKSGSKNGDPLNIAFIGDRDQIFSALIRRGWHQTEVTYASSAWKTFKSFVFGSRYHYSPISPLYTFGRSQDIGLQKARDSIHLRNHMRLWRTPYEYQGVEVYIGQISRDVGVKFSARTVTTHAIDANIDNTRDSLIGDLAYSQSMHAFGMVLGSQASTLDDTYYNLTPDPYYSDGLRAVMFFAERPTTLEQIELKNWVSPRKSTLFGVPLGEALENQK